MEYSLATLMMNIVNDEKLNIEKTILHHKEGVDLIPANIELSAIEVSLVNAMSRELILRSMVEKLRDFYDFIIIDCMPSLGMMTINALACADSVLIPVQAAYLPVKGLQQLIKTIGIVKKQLNPKLKIEGILLTMVDNRTNYVRDISLMVYDTLVNGSSARYHELMKIIKDAEEKMAQNKVLKTHIINYAKTRDTYIAYRKSGYSKKFYEAHRDEIILHKAAKEVFSKLPDGKIPKVKDLNEEFARLLSEKKAAYSEYKKIKKEMRYYQIAKQNVESFYAAQQTWNQEENLKKKRQQQR